MKQERRDRLWPFVDEYVAIGDGGEVMVFITLNWLVSRTFFVGAATPAEQGLAVTVRRNFKYFQGTTQSWAAGTESIIEQH